MQRARVSVLIRKGDPGHLRAVMLGNPGAWSLNLQLSWAILRNDLAVSVTGARKLILRSSKAAQECAIRMNERVRQSDLSERAEKVKQALQRLSHCAERAPARLRHLLDHRMERLLQDRQVDLETIEALFRASRETFEQFPESKAAQTALRALGVYREHGYNVTGLSTDFLSLSPLLRGSCTSALSLVVQSGSPAGAITVFEVLSEAISPPAPPPRGAADIVIDYVAAVAAAWRAAGLQAGRAQKRGDLAYTSRFHRFCDLILTALVEPHSRRHERDLQKLSDTAWARQRQLPREYRNDVRGGLPRRDTQWLVTAHCLREGLRRFKKTESRLHMIGG